MATEEDMQATIQAYNQVLNLITIRQQMRTIGYDVRRFPCVIEGKRPLEL
jgi:hypothetical protein